MRLLLGGAIVSFGLSSLLVAQAQQPVSDTQVAAMVEALRKAAPPASANSGYYSEWKVKPETLKGWTKFCLKQELTPAQFENSPGTARKVVSCIMRRELDKQLRATNNNENAAVRGVACWWMTGNYTGCNSGFTGNYVKKVISLYQQERSKPTPSS